MRARNPMIPNHPSPTHGENLEVDDIEAIGLDVERPGGRLLELREPVGGVPVRVATLVDFEGNGCELRQAP